MTDNYSVHSLEWWNCLNFVIKCVVDHISVLDGGMFRRCFLVCERMLHPLAILSLGEVISGVCASGLLSVFGGVDNHFAVNEQVLELECLNEVGVPHLSSVAHLNIIIHLRNVVHFSATLLKPILSSEDCSVSLHSPLKLISNLGSAMLSVSISHLI